MRNLIRLPRHVLSLISAHISILEAPVNHKDQKKLTLPSFILTLSLSSIVMSDPLSVEDYLAFPTVDADHRINYGDEDLQFGDLWIPSGAGPYPVVVVIHGGCWRDAYNIDPTSDFSATLSNHGVAVWNLEYRRVGNIGGGWPGTFLDVAMGVDFLRTLATRYPLDLQRIVATGHSAGGQLALWLAGRSRIPEDSELFIPNPLTVHGAVPLAPVPDMRAAVRDLRQSEACNAAILNVMGGNPQLVPDNYSQGSPMEMLPLRIPQHLVVGLKDDPALVKNVRGYYSAAKNAGDDVELTLFEEAGHFEIVGTKTKEWPIVRDAILKMVGTTVPSASNE